MPSTLSVAAVQTAAHDRTSFASAWPGILQRVSDAAAAGADLVVLPEGSLPAYVLGYAQYDGSEIAQALEQCAAVAREHSIVLVAGAARHVENRTYNSAIVFDRNHGVVGWADKHFLWHFDHQWFEEGERIEPVRTSIGTLGVMVCADGRIPLIARTLVDRGAQMLVMPTAWVTSGRDPADPENIQADLLARIRARENGVPFAAANKCGIERNCVAYCGKSQIISADGLVLALAAHDRPQTIAARIEFGSGMARSPVGSIPVETAARRHRAVRIAITPQPPSDESLMEECLRLVQAELLVMPDTTYPSAGSEAAPLAFVDDAMLLDPAGLAALSLSGVDLMLWTTTMEPQWQRDFARARAIELRIYLIVVDRKRRRAYAVDPDGSILCGTFGDYRTAAFTYDPARSQQTTVAPGTDVRAGLRRAYDDAAQQ